MFKNVCSVQSCLFVQCWAGIILVQCRENLCNVGTTFEATSYYQKINQSEIKIAEKGCCSEKIHLPFSCTMSLRQHCTRILPVQCSPKSITTTLNKIFSCAMLSEASWTTLNNILPVQYSPKSI